MYRYRSLQYVHIPTTSISHFEILKLTSEVTQQSDTTTLLGSSRRDYLDVIKWMSFANSEYLPTAGGILLPLIGRHQILRMNSEDCLKAMHLNFQILNERLKETTYLVGEQVTLADFFHVGLLAPTFMVAHQVVHTNYPSLTRWFYEVYSIPMFKEVAGDLPMLDIPFPALPIEKSEEIPKKQDDARQEAIIGA